MKVALRCDYGSPRRKSSLLALRSTSACKIGRNLPLNIIDEECLDLANPEIPFDQHEAKGFSPVADVPPAADELTGDGSPPQDSRTATPFALKRETHVPKGTRTGGADKEIPPDPPRVLTTPFFVDALETPSVQADDDSPTLSNLAGQKPPSASRNRHEHSGAAATTVPGKCVPTSGLGPQAGHVARRYR